METKEKAMLALCVYYLMLVRYYYVLFLDLMN